MPRTRRNTIVNSPRTRPNLIVSLQNLKLRMKSAKKIGINVLPTSEVKSEDRGVPSVTLPKR